MKTHINSDRIKQYIKSHNLNEKSFSVVCNISYTQFRSVLYGCTPGVDMIYNISEVMDCNMEDLIVIDWEE